MFVICDETVLIDLFVVFLLHFDCGVVSRPVAGSLTEARGQKANIHVFREMLELCEIINSEGYSHCKETPKLKVILFGELFNVSSSKSQTKSQFIRFECGFMFFSWLIESFGFEICKQIYTSINDKLVGLLLRARKYKFVEFEGGKFTAIINDIFIILYTYEHTNNIHLKSLKCQFVTKPLLLFWIHLNMRQRQLPLYLLKIKIIPSNFFWNLELIWLRLKSFASQCMMFKAECSVHSRSRNNDVAN